MAWRASQALVAAGWIYLGLILAGASGEGVLAAICRPTFGLAAPGESFFPMQDDVVHYAGQPVALVVAERYEQALTEAATAVR